MFQVLMEANQYPDLARSAEKLMAFAALIIEMQGKAESMEMDAFYDEVCQDSGYLTMLEAKNDVESRSRAENVKELRSSIVSYLDNHPEGVSLAGFLDEIALYTDLDNQNPDDNSVVMMTMHSAKGLEFPSVYVVGLEENVFPGSRAMGDIEEMEEERRLCYVAMTRAKEHLTMTNARQRMLFGHTTNNLASRFLGEIPAKNCDWQGKQTERPREAKPRYDYGFSGAAGVSGISGVGASSRGGFNRPVSVRNTHSQSAAKPTALSLKKGDMVQHKAFGRGMVMSIQPMGGDALIEIAFDEHGTKRLMMNSAKAFMKKE